MKIEKRYLGLRICTFWIKLIFSLVWNILFTFVVTYKWILYGSQELLYGKDGKEGLVTLIEQNEEIIKLLKEQQNGTKK